MTGSAGRASPQDGPPNPDDPVLRAKYLDYCSARVAEALLTLSPDEIFLLAEGATREMPDEGSSPLTYDEMVQLATGRISRELKLPGFREWVKAYREDPATFERELLGLWESDAGSDD